MGVGVHDSHEKGTHQSFYALGNFRCRQCHGPALIIKMREENNL